MNKKLYIVPGLDDTCSREPYQLLKQMAERKGYQVIPKDVDWKSNLSKQIFSVDATDILFGFSLGAVLVRLVAQQYACKHIILGSMTPLRDFKGGEMRDALIDILGPDFVNDVRDNLQPGHKANKQTIIYGDKENEPGDIIVSNTDHEITQAYISEIEKII